MTEIDISPHAGLGGLVSNTDGEPYLAAINPDVFKDTDSSSVFGSYFGNSLFKQDTFYVIAGTDSGLLYQHIKKQGIPKGSRYLFVELPQVLALLGDLDDANAELAVTSLENWLDQAKAMEIQKFAVQGRLTLIHSLGVTHGHYKDYPPFSRRLKEELDAYDSEQKAILNNYFYTMCQIENLTENQVPAICLKNTFKGKTAVLLAAGPSLNDIFPWVRKHRQNLLVIAVSRISHSLLQAGIQPDICVSIDPNHVNLRVSLEMLEFQNGTLLVNNYHVSPYLLSSWGGEKMFIGPRYPWPTPLEPENLPISDGSTVTDSAFALAIEMGVTQIILGGADFCFNQQGYTHASGSLEHAVGPRPTQVQQQVETNNGMMADTLYAYRESAMSLDLRAQTAIASGCRTINPAPGAMRLPHVEHLDLGAIQVEPLEQPARATLATCASSSEDSKRSGFYKEVLGELDRVLKELRTIKELSSKAIIYNRKLFAKGEQGAGFHNKAKVEHIEEQLNNKYAHTATFIRHFGVSHFIPLLQLDDDQRVEDLEESCRLYHQAMVTTSDELTNILQQARTRTLSRLEEEKPQPKVQRLLEQWRHDRHPGRAIQWTRRHVNYVTDLPEAQQQALRVFQDTFEELVEELGQSYNRGINWSVDLGDICAKTQEYFNCRDHEGLQRLLAMLQAHRDKERSAYFIPLAEAYLAELRDEPQVAIEAYQAITEGPAHSIALMRLFELYAKAQDWDSALRVLKTLSGISPVYSLMYADMLQATGDIDSAVAVYTDYVLAHPDDLDTVMKLGKLFQQCEMAEGVAWAMGYILDKEPGNQAALQILAECGLDVGNSLKNSP